MNSFRYDTYWLYFNDYFILIIILQLLFYFQVEATEGSKPKKASEK